MTGKQSRIDEVYERSARMAESVFRDLKDGDLPQTIRKDLRETWDFYLDEEERKRLAAMGPLQRWFTSSWLLVKSLFLKLTPVRRMILGFGAFLALDGAGFFNDASTGNLLLGFFLSLFVLGLELKDKLLAHDELAAGRAVQIALMPQKSPSFEGWDLWLHTEPANDVGGDLVDFQDLDARRFSVALGDVAGKGLPAALFMARLQATVRAIAPSCRSLAEVGARVNEIFHRDGLPGKFASLVLMETERNAAIVRVMNAGHLPPWVIRADGPSPLSKGSPAIGLSASARFSETELALEPGDAVVVVSDGVTEARDEEGRFFGDDRVRLALAGAHGRSSRDVGVRILAAVADFVGDAPASDDLSIVVLRRAPAPLLPA